MFDLARFHLGCIFVRLGLVLQARLAGSVTRCQVYSAVYSAVYTIYSAAHQVTSQPLSHILARAHWTSQQWKWLLLPLWQLTSGPRSRISNDGAAAVDLLEVVIVMVGRGDVGVDCLAVCFVASLWVWGRGRRWRRKVRCWRADVQNDSRLYF